MITLSRKQREIANRHALFLDIARTVIHEEGFHQLSMERVAELAEYSKGTVYQHFPCKEEMLIQVCVSTMTELLSLFRRAVEFNGTNRERLHAVFYAHDLWAKLEPRNVCMIQHLSVDGVKQKTCDGSLHKHGAMEQQLTSTVSGIIQDAIDAGELKSSLLNPGELVFTLWSLSHGGQLLQSYDVPLDAMGVRDPGMALSNMISACLDGLGMQPHSSKLNFDVLYQRFRTELFAEEVQRLSATDNPALSALGD
ncbi:MAG: TetR/AcrR family transcriptional regulator [Granulosicoccus sp.]